MHSLINFNSNQNAKTIVNIDGVITYSPSKSYSSILISTPNLKIDETYNISYALKSFPEITASLDDSQIATLDSNVILGKQVGESTLTLTLDGKKQLVNVKVHEKGALGATFSFELGRLAYKKIVAFGDSVTANATIGGGNTYYNNFANKFRMSDVKNYAILIVPR